MKIDKLRAMLAAANQDIDQLVLFRNNHLPTLLDRLDKLEAVAKAAKVVYPIDTRAPQLIEALAALEKV